MEGSVGVLVAAAVAKLFSLSGIGGFLAGLVARRLTVAIAIAALCGTFDTVILASASSSSVPLLAWLASMGLAGATALMGWLLRERKRVPAQ